MADLFGVDPKTVARWADAGQLPCIRTLGGHRRWRKGDVDAALEQRATATIFGRGLDANFNRNRIEHDRPEVS